MKKVLAIALVLCLVVGAVFADKGKLEVGVNAGYAEEFTQVDYSKNSYSEKIVALQPAFNVTATVGYGITNDLSLKAEIGAYINGKIKTQITINGVNDDPVTASDPTPMNFNFFIGAEYGMEFSKGCDLVGGLGADILMGKQSCADNETSNTRIGFGVELIGKYEISKNLKINLGGKFAVHFINTSDESTAHIASLIKSYEKRVDTFGGSTGHFQGAFGVFAGVTYSL